LNKGQILTRDDGAGTARARCDELQIRAKKSRGAEQQKVYNKSFLISFAITYVLALLSAPVTTQTLREGCLHVRALFRPPEGS
jgi:hypothetical protein